MKLTLQSFEECGSREKLHELWNEFLDLLYEDEEMTEEYANGLLQAYLLASRRLSLLRENQAAFLLIPKHLIVNKS